MNNNDAIFEKARELGELIKAATLDKGQRKPARLCFLMKLQKGL